MITLNTLDSILVLNDRLHNNSVVYAIQIKQFCKLPFSGIIPSDAIEGHHTR